MYTDLYVVYRASETECNCYWRLTKDSPTNKRKQHKQKRNTPQPPRRTNKQTYVCSPLCLKSSPRNKRVNKTRENKIYFATIHKQSPGERELSLISDILKLLPKLVINDGLGKQRMNTCRNVNMEQLANVYVGQDNWLSMVDSNK